MSRNKNALKVFIPILLLAAVFLLGSQFMVNSLGSLDAHSNVSEEYQGQYNDTREASITTISLVKTIPLILGAFGFIGVVFFVVKKRNR